MFYIYMLHIWHTICDIWSVTTTYDKWRWQINHRLHYTVIFKILKSFDLMNHWNKNRIKRREKKKSYDSSRRWSSLYLVSCHWLFYGSGRGRRVGGGGEVWGRGSERRWWRLVCDKQDDNLRGPSRGKRGHPVPLNQESPPPSSSCGTLKFPCTATVCLLHYSGFCFSPPLSCFLTCPCTLSLYFCFSPSSQSSLLFLASSHTLSTLYLLHLLLCSLLKILWFC